MNDLLPCKACGHERRIVSYNRTIGTVVCENCGVGVEAEQPDAPIKAGKLWNALQSGEVAK